MNETPYNLKDKGREINWYREPSPGFEREVVALTIRNSLGVLHRALDGWNMKRWKREDIHCYQKIITPIILSALDALKGNTHLMAKNSKAATEWLAKLDAGWDHVSNAINAISDVGFIDVVVADNKDELAFHCTVSKQLVNMLADLKAEPKQQKVAAGMAIAPKLPAAAHDEALNLDHSRLLDVHTWSAHPEVNKFVGAIYKEHFAPGGKVEIKKKHLKVVLLDLYLAWSDDPALMISFYRNINEYKAGTRYNALRISRTIIPVVDKLIEVGFLNHETGFYDRRAGGRSRVSRMWPTDALIEIFRDVRFGTLDIGDHENRECIILRDENEVGIEYRDADETKRMRMVLSDYNSLLQTTFIDIPTLEHSWIDLQPDDLAKKNRRYVNQSNKFVRRIFNRSSFELGGRFYGGWWQGCPQEWRANIFMDDHPISEIDYSGLHIVILYAQAGVNYWEEINEDPYTIDRPDFIESNEECRAICKSLILMALNARDENSTYQAFRDDADTGSPYKRFKNVQLKEILQGLRQKHPQIADRFASDVGIELMNIDSQITEKIIEHYTDQEIPVLPLHDSYLVPYGLEDDLRKKMVSAFAQVTGIDGVKLKEVTHRPDIWEPLDLDDAKGFDHVTWEMVMKARHDPQRSKRYQHHWQEFIEHFDKPETPPWGPVNEEA